jgi:hypothetical protein
VVFVTFTRLYFARINQEEKKLQELWNALSEEKKKEYKLSK